MREKTSLFFLLPLLLPLGGAWIAWILPSSGSLGRARRWLHIFALLSAGAFLVVLGTHRPETVSFPFWGQPFDYEGLEFSVDALAINFAALLVGVLTVISLSMTTRPMDRFDTVTSLILIGSGVGTCMAANLLTLCLMWTLTGLALLGIGFIRVPEEGIPHAIRNMLGNVLSTFALITAAILVIVEHKTTRLAELSLSGVSLELLMAAALLRLSVYPLPGSFKRRWEAHLASLGTGGYLWLRIVSLTAAKLPGVTWLIPFCGGTIFVTALLASLAPDFGTSLPYLLLNGVALIVCAPLIETQVGLGVAWIAAINLGLCLALIRTDVQVRPVGPLRRWARIPLMVALGSLTGWPLTLGFVVHWSFLKLCWVAGWRGFVLLGSVSFLLASVPIWGRLRQIRYESGERNGAPRVSVWISWGCVCLLAIALLALGIMPPLLQRLWPRLSGVSQLPALSVLFGKGIKQIGLLVLTVVIVPILGGYAFQRLWAGAPRGLTRMADVASAVLELDWLYLALEGLLVRARFLINQFAITIEQALCLSWVLLWSLLITLFLLGGRP